MAASLRFINIPSFNDKFSLRSHGRSASKVSARMATSFNGGRVVMARKASRGSDRKRVVSVQAEEQWRVLAKAEIPALVPRGDFLDQLLKWCISEFEENGRRRYGMKMVVDICDDYLTPNGEPSAFCIKMRGPEESLDLFVCMDEEVVKVEKSMGGLGVEVTENQEDNPFAQNFDIVGKNLIIRRREGPLPESLRELAGQVLQAVSKAVNTYYAFGSVYSDDAT